MTSLYTIILFIMCATISGGFALRKSHKAKSEGADIGWGALGIVIFIIGIAVPITVTTSQNPINMSPLWCILFIIPFILALFLSDWSLFKDIKNIVDKHLWERIGTLSASVEEYRETINIQENKIKELKKQLEDSQKLITNNYPSIKLHL